jgi:hypothetical protein
MRRRCISRENVSLIQGEEKGESHLPEDRALIYVHVHIGKILRKKERRKKERRKKERSGLPSGVCPNSQSAGEATMPLIWRSPSVGDDMAKSIGEWDGPDVRCMPGLRDLSTVDGGSVMGNPRNGEDSGLRKVVSLHRSTADAESVGEICGSVRIRA